MAGGLARRADGGAQIHQRLHEIAGLRMRHQRLGKLANFGFRRGQRRFDGVEPGDHPLGIAVDGRIGTDTGKGAQARLRVGEAPAEFRRHLTGADMEIAGAGIIAKPGPGPQDIVEGSGAQGVDIRPEAKEFGVIAAYRRHRGLLQHDFGQPDTVGVGGRTRLCPPGQVAGLPGIPGEETAGELFRVPLFGHGGWANTDSR
jgi:hypothetical protein